ncbi:NAD(P)/FAD-dependent oxidoreductase [Mesorhizobium australafricanum]|uniref:FAD-binding oxidoreductase n=1 Tax=Mesorhizobium australafricanum TaxID=3072311 RepID=A0ABU4X8D0_9HYPH|nr:FAD-binding oxidoreductase [Mesorhizobium sp. VK3E]MDX8443334.1 FAD-binding oxidoreductase [Mesorhizobium sp. VK3E]
MGAAFLHPQFKNEPYWHEAAPRRDGPFADVPRSVDVLIVGSGYTGMSAARTLAKAGRQVVVLDAGRPGDGASSRNAGFVGTSLLASFSRLRKIAGVEKAVEAYTEAKRAYAFVTELIRQESIDCTFEQNGRIYWAYTTSQLDGLKSEFAEMQRHLGKKGEIIGPDHASGESGSRLYCGGLLLPETGALHPGKWHDGLMGLAEAAGATVIGKVAVKKIAPAGKGHSVSTTRGTVNAREVIVATDGYIGNETPALRRRILPVNVQVVATEPLAPGVVQRIMPTHRVHADVRAMPQYWRLSPDKTRLLLCARSGLPNGDMVAQVRANHRSIVELFPQLEGARITHYWTGRTGFTSNRMPHLGTRDGIHFALGFNGAGVAMGAYIGHCIASRVIGGGGCGSVFSEGKFATVPFGASGSRFVPLLSTLATIRRWLEIQAG